MQSDPFFELPPVHYDDGERFGTSVEMIAEIRRLRAALEAERQSEIARLEKILNSEDDKPVRITPDGRVVEMVTDAA